MGAIYRNGYKYGDGNGVAQNPVLAIKSGNELYKPENGIVELPDEAITVSATGSDLNISTSEGRLNALTIYGKSEIVDGSIESAGEGWTAVDLGTLNWTKPIGEVYVYYAKISENITDAIVPAEQTKYLFIGKYAKSAAPNIQDTGDKTYFQYGKYVYIRDDAYTTPTAFKTAMSGVLLCYKEATPTNNTIAIKTDNVSGIDGTMATFNTGTPLYGIANGAKDAATWYGAFGEVVKNCRKAKLADLTWDRTGITSLFQADVSDMYSVTTTDERNKHFLCSSYSASTILFIDSRMDDPSMLTDDTKIFIYDTRYSELTNFVASLGDAELIYELATPTTIPLITAENASIAGLRTFTPSTHVQNNTGADMAVNAYARTANGKAVNAVNVELDSVIDDSAAASTSTYSSEKIEDLLAEAVPKKIDISGSAPKLDKTIGQTWNVAFNKAIGIGMFVWTDGENIYYSQGTNQYVYNKATSTWSDKTWTGLTSFTGNYIWTDGENIYYSSGSTQYVLNKATSTWSTKTWSGLTSFDGDVIWTDGENIYYSKSLTQYVLNKSTSTWSAKTWSGLSSLDGDFTWTDGENIYYSSGSTQYILDKAASTWSTKTWSGLSSFSGKLIWTDGEDIYYSSNSDHYVLDKAASTWSTKTWVGDVTELLGLYIWTDGENIYHSSGNVTVRLLPKRKIGSTRLR